MALLDRIRGWFYYVLTRALEASISPGKFDGIDSLRLDAHRDDQAVMGNQGYFEGRELILN